LTYRLITDDPVDRDVTSAFSWYNGESRGLGHDFLAELRSVYDRILEGPLKYPRVHSSTRRAILRRFPYAVYFTVDDDSVVILAVLHTSRDPGEWQRR